MALLAVLLVGFAAWLILSGRLQRMTALDGMMLGLAITGALLSERGSLWGIVPLGLAAAYGFGRSKWRVAEARAQASATAAAAPVEPQQVREARALLGVDEHADEQAIREAHRRLIAKTHPDAGGTQALAEKINEARSILLRHALETNGAQRAPTASPQ